MIETDDEVSICNVNSHLFLYSFISSLSLFISFFHSDFSLFPSATFISHLIISLWLVALYHKIATALCHVTHTEQYD